MQQALPDGGEHCWRLIRIGRLALRVRRFSFECKRDGSVRRIIVKQLNVAESERTRLLSHACLPAVGLADLTTPLLAVANDAKSQFVLHAYEDLSGIALHENRFREDQV